jgi:hypothetical protein
LSEDRIEVSFRFEGTVYLVYIFVKSEDRIEVSFRFEDIVCTWSMFLFRSEDRIEVSFGFEDTTHLEQGEKLAEVLGTVVNTIAFSDLWVRARGNASTFCSVHLEKI